MGFASPAHGGQALCLEQAQCSALPVTGVLEHYPPGFVVPRHAHTRGHLVYTSTGVLLVQAASGQWLVPPTTAVWLRPGVLHQLQAVTAVSAHGLLIDEALCGPLPAADCVVHVSPLVRELIAELVQLPHQGQAQARERLLGLLLIEEVASAAPLPFYLPWPEEPLLREICAALMQEPAQSWSAEQLASHYALTAKTLQRRFVKSTGLTLGKWRKSMRLMRSIQWLLQGMSMTHAALESGYDSLSAYSVAFKKQFGCPPSQFAESFNNTLDMADPVLQGQPL